MQWCAWCLLCLCASPEHSCAFFPLVAYSRQTSSIPCEAFLLPNPAAARSLPGQAMERWPQMKRILERSPQDQQNKRASAGPSSTMTLLIGITHPTDPLLRALVTYYLLSISLCHRG